MWAQRRENKRKEIDEDLCQKYQGEGARLKDEYEKLKLDLHARHKVEHSELKAQYIKMKEEQQLDISTLQDIGKRKGLELQALEHKFAEQRQTLVKDPNKH